MTSDGSGLTLRQWWNGRRDAAAAAARVVEEKLKVVNTAALALDEAHPGEDPCDLDDRPCTGCSAKGAQLTVAKYEMTLAVRACPRWVQLLMWTLEGVWYRRRLWGGGRRPLSERIVHKLLRRAVFGVFLRG